MKNIDILVMMNSGIGNITTYDLSSASSYKVVKFRNKIVSEYNKIQEKERKILVDVGISNPQDFDDRYKELREKKDRTTSENEELTSYTNKYNAWISARTQMLDEEVDLSNLKTIPYDDWHILRKENKPKKEEDIDPLNNYIERILENVLWKAPDNE